uniref:LAGLIDADG homing endonuclease n=1 Tax=Cyathus striatus TaxID=68777 RepID=UPI0023F041F5
YKKVYMNMNNKNKFVRFYRTSSKYKLELLPELEEILIGLMLGDLYAEKIKPTSNTRLQFKQSIKNEAYILHLYSIFKEYCNSGPKITTSIEKRSNKKGLNTSIKFWTSSLPCFNKFRELFYNELGIKYIPNNLEDLITSRSLAYWVMDDGYNSRVTNGFYFCTESFTLEDNYKLKNILKSKFNLDCGVHKHSSGHRLYVFSTSKERLSELVKPHLISHFYYKLNKQSEIQ